MPNEKILVVDDEPKIVELVRLYLEREGYRVSAAGDGRAALSAFRQEKPNLVVLDLMLPELDGREVCRALRKESAVPIIMLTARAEEADKLIGLELGADDYLTKPFSPRELVARVRAVLRRAASPPAPEEALAVGDLHLDLARHEARCADRPLELTATEFKLLAALAQNPGRVLSRQRLLDLARGEDYEGLERTIDSHIKNLRLKLAPPGKPGCRIATVRGVGYRLEGAP